MAMFSLWSSSMVVMLVSLGSLTITSSFPTPIPPEEPLITNSSSSNSSDISTGTLFILDTNDTFSVQEIHGGLAKTIHVKFVLRFPTTYCCPVLYFFSQAPNSYHVPTHVTKGCFHGGQSFHSRATLSQHFVITGISSHHPRCEVIGGDYVCRGERGFRSAQRRSWFWAVGHECGKEKPLNLSMEMDVVLDRPSKCTAFDTVLKCGYHYTVLPNLLGDIHMEDAIKYAYMLQYVHCHQHFRAYSCRLLFPACKGRQSKTSELEVIMPCKKMCKEIAAACSKALGIWNHPVSCEAYPDSLDPEVCYYMQVTCPNPTPPEFGQVIVKGSHHKAISHFTCKEDFFLEGDASINCTFAGIWNGTIPKCVLSEKSGYDKTKTALILTAAAFVSIATSCIIIMILRIRNTPKTNGNSEKPPHPPVPVVMAMENRRNIFLTYSSEDKNIVNDIWIPVMHTRLSSWRVITHETDFLPGRRVTECIEEAISDSDIVVALLTQNYLASDWCMLELSHAQVRARRDPGFKLVLSLHGVEEEKLPDAISECKETWGVLHLSDPLFWELLVKYLQA